MATQAHGFAGKDGGTTGGSGGKTVTVSTGDKLQAAINSSGSKPLTIVVDGKITPQNTKADEITLSNKHDITIAGKGKSGELDGIGLHIKSESSDIVIQNLKIHDVKAGPKDAIGIEGGSHNIWVDHNELSSSMSAGKDDYDGLLDIKRGAHNITVSNNYFHDHHKVSLVGYSDSDKGVWDVTYDHNVFENVGSRLPSVRGGEAHIYDNYFRNVEVSGVNLRDGAVGLVENNVFENVHNPVASLDSTKPGTWDLRGNSLSNITWSKPGSGEAVAGSDMKSTAHWSAPYSYSLTPTKDVKAYDLAHAGIGKLDAAADAAAADSASGTVPADGTAGNAAQDATGTAGGGTSGGSKALQGTGAADTLTGAAGAEVISGSGGRDLLDGSGGNDTLLGGTNDDTLHGGDGNDLVEGGSGKNLLAGGGGTDTLSGGEGNNVFAFGDGDSGIGGTRDVVTDFHAGDVIDLSGIDARSGTSGDQAFTFIGGNGFGRHAGELRVSTQSGYVLVEGDTDGDGQADFQIELTGSTVPGQSDFIL